MRRLFCNFSCSFSCVSSLLLGLLAMTTAAHAQIVVGQSASLTGGTAEHSRQFTEGAQSCFKAVNKRGGVNGQMIELKTLDDKGDAALARKNSEQLLSEDKATVLFGYTTRPTSEAGLAVAEAQKAVFFAPASGGESLRTGKSPYAFHVRPGYGAEYKKIVDTLATTGIRSFSVVVNTDDNSNEKAVADALTNHGLKIEAIGRVPRNAVDVAEASATLVKANAAVLVIAASGKSVAPLLVSMRNAGYRGQFATMSLIGATLPQELGDHAPGLIVTNVVPNPAKAADPLVREAARDLRAYAPDAKVSFSGLEGYASACTLAEVLRRTGGNVRGAKLASAIEGMNDISLANGSFRLAFDKNRHTGSNFVDVTIVGASGKLIF